jgi:hypothetical protein
MYRIMNGIIALSQVMELGRLANETAKTASSKGLFAPLNLTESTLWDADGGFPASTLISSILRFLRSDRFLSSRNGSERLDLLRLTAALSSPVNI